MKKVDPACGNERRVILSCHIDLSLSAGRDMLLRFAPCALVMGNNVTMIRAIIPHFSLCTLSLQEARQKDNFALRLQPLHH